MLRGVCNYFALSVVWFALWRCGVAGPLGARDPPLKLTGTACGVRARSLLWNISAVLEMDHLFSGFDCSQQNADVHLRTQTVSACTPQNSGCTYGTVLNIDENKCLQSILEDLQFYRDTLSAYANPDLTKTAVQSIDDVMKVKPFLSQSYNGGLWTLTQRTCTEKSKLNIDCFSVSAIDSSPEKVSVDHQKSFQERLQLCKVLKGFSLRAMTINRVFNYILSK